ncbi:hypothetical protein, partial [Methanobrevibacter sp.]|uniref:hypothetical protein n=1 Tax=Methanobrevibacter sp. TaxID=66852 RepID=UPI00388E225C
DSSKSTSGTENVESEKSVTTTERDTTAESKYKGFNAEEPVVVTQTDGNEEINNSKVTETSEKTDSISETGAEERESSISGNDDSTRSTTLSHTEENTNEKVSTHTGTETTRRFGNIGITTSQQMLQQELEVRKYDFYKMIYKDIDSVLCLSIY